MVGTMAPVVYGNDLSRPRGSWLLALLQYTAASTVAGSILGIAFGFLGSMVPLGSSRNVLAMVIVGSMALVYSLHEFKLLSLPMPQRKRQVPAEWRYRYHPYVTAWLFGGLLGIGYATFVPVATLYVATVAAVLNGSLAYGAALLGLFALGRAGTLWPIVLCSGRNLRQIPQVSADLVAVEPLIHLGSGFLLAAVGGCLLVGWALSFG